MPTQTQIDRAGTGRFSGSPIPRNEYPATPRSTAASSREAVLRVYPRQLVPRHLFRNRSGGNFFTGSGFDSMRAEKVVEGDVDAIDKCSATMGDLAVIRDLRERHAVCLFFSHFLAHSSDPTCGFRGAEGDPEPGVGVVAQSGGLARRALLSFRRPETQANHNPMVPPKMLNS